MVGSGGVGKSALTLQFMYDEVRLHLELSSQLTQRFSYASNGLSHIRYINIGLDAGAEIANLLCSYESEYIEKVNRI